MNSIFYRIAILLLVTIVYPSCKTEKFVEPTDSHQLSYPLVKKTIDWFNENSALPISTNKRDIDVKEYTPDWQHFKIHINQNGVEEITVPLIKTNNNKVLAFYTEIGLVLDKDGKPLGMIKEYVGNPYIGETTLNMYTGSGRMFDRGIYNAISRTFTSAVKRRSNTPNSQ
ncbi:hypothetical protein H7U22_14325 [Pedobacter sp. CCM 8938]|uniref:Uncharacterized protein n=2 Tax=Pedobacter fastidiosus TaxID=2765361 RepID=A0ABR7KUA3_9SPHI|nr:hypothetical protein [Pedobacter fastidiosus]MBC6111598.1 hypothetical protein [Pedobacter fastidiosus]